MNLLGARRALRAGVRAIVFASIWLWCGTVVQASAELDELFARLQSIQDPDEAPAIEDRIWDIWRHDADDYTLGLLDLAKAYLSRHGPDAAIRVYDELLKQEPDYAHGLNARATLHYTIGDFQKSLDDIERVLVLEPRHYGAMYGKGLVFIEQQRFEDARAAFDAVVHINPHAGGLVWALERLERRQLESTQ
ncbi:MAG: hypothetical protein CMO26_10015 [Thiotrichales bacterium]|nr:hypothetical protein [Thiotrichales bacterium]